MNSHANSLVTTLNPTFEGEYARRFDTLCRDLSHLNGREATAKSRRDARIKEEIDWVDGRRANRIAAQKYLTGVLILSDLLNSSWQIHHSPAGLELISPSPKRAKGLNEDEIGRIKDEIRNDLAESVRRQLEDPTTQNFVQRMESPHERSIQHEPISVLIADGDELAARLEPTLALAKDERDQYLAEAIQPYLQLVEPDDRDEFTGIKLGEIWRYFRLTWSIPSTNVPGRQLLYLVRDAAHPYHAVMGIAALSNSAMQVKDRDDFIGWTSQEFTNRFREIVENSDAEAVQGLLSLLECYIEQGLEDVDWRGLTTEVEIAQPDEGVVNRLRTEVGRFIELRRQELRELQEDDEVEAESLTVFHEMADAEADLERPQVSDEILALDKKVDTERLNPARRLLIFKKRAFELSRLLQARMVFQRLRRAPDLLGAISANLRREAFQTAVNSAIFANKRVRIGINLLEITTCGAIEPYNHLLSGKLVALLMMSPQVGADYRRRYGGKPSLIMSQLRNEEVIRSCDLVYLGTTSLYSIGSSQYNRLRLPAGTFDPEQPELRYRQVGYTSGFGTVQFSSDTSRALNTLEVMDAGYQDVNSIFGEGFSPKLRRIRSGLANLGFDPEVMLRHNQPRVLYAVELCANARAFLGGETESLPRYIRDPQAPREATTKIVDFWRTRWLSRRIRNQQIDVLARVRRSQPFSLSQSEQIESNALTTNVEGKMPSPVIPEPSSSVSVEFVQRLYRDTSAYADQLDASQRNAINIDTPLEAYVIDKVNEGYSVILTGNAGDGKTHILTRLESRLKVAGTKLILDASVVTSEEIIATWRAALNEGVPFCMAANEWPLHMLTTQYVKDLPLLGAIRPQLNAQLVYGDEDQADTADIEDRLVVIDLGKRNHLQKAFFKAALAAVLREDLYEQCPRCELYDECDAVRNRRLLSEERVAERLGQVIERLAVMGHHVTVRELLSMISYMVFGGRTCKNLFSTSGRRDGFYSDQLFATDAKGVIFDLLRQYVDPAKISHPHWDAELYYNETDGADWLDLESVEPVWGNKLNQPQAAFEHVKRRFYFEHAAGDQILNMLPQDEQDFYRLTDPENDDIDDILDDILQVINRFFCPVLNDDESTRWLYVWTTHHYDERAPKAFLCKQQIERARHLTIQHPRLASHLREAFTYYPDHVRLIVFPEDEDRTRWLDIDFPLFKMLRDVKRGLPPMLAPEEQTVRLYQFMHALAAVEIPTRTNRREILSYVIGSKHLLRINVNTASHELRLSEL